MDKLYFLLLLTLVAGCASISEGGKKVKLTENISDIENCKYLNKIASNPPYGLPDDWKIQLKNQAAILGGNVVLAFPKIFTTSIKGKVYLCEKP